MIVFIRINALCSQIAELINSFVIVLTIDETTHLHPNECNLQTKNNTPVVKQSLKILIVNSYVLNLFCCVNV